MKKNCQVLIAALAFLPGVATAALLETQMSLGAPATETLISGEKGVDCDGGQTLNQALNSTATIINLRFKGTCTENVSIRRDNVTIAGSEGATIVGSVQVVSASNVHLSGFTVRDNVATEGAIEALAGSSITVTDVVIENAVNRGIHIADSVASFFGTITVTDSGTTGFLGRGSRLNFEADMTISSSLQFDLILTDGTSAFSIEGNIVSDGSQGGIAIQNSSSFEGVFGSMTSTNHPLVGLVVATQGTLVYAFDLNVSNNGVAGILIDEVSSVSPFENITAQADTTLMNNGIVGAAVQTGSTLTLGGTTTISGNSFGVLVDAGILLTADADISGNTNGDVVLQFGSKASFDGGNTIGVVLCDGTELTRGDAACAESGENTR